MKLIKKAWLVEEVNGGFIIEAYNKGLGEGIPEKKMVVKTVYAVRKAIKEELANMVNQRKEEIAGYSEPTKSEGNYDVGQ